MLNFLNIEMSHFDTACSDNLRYRAKFHSDRLNVREILQ